LSRIQEKLDLWKRLSREFEEVEALAEILEEEEDSELLEEFYSRAGALKDEIESFQIKLLMDEEHDNCDAILSIHPGAGGLDSQDWAKMLLRMYLRWAERRKYDVEVAELLEDEGAGIKSATVFIKGQFAYGYLKAERGIHRLVRISPFDAARRRHTSFTSVDVLPELPEDADVEIRPEDLKIDTFRASGAGGQYVNMTDSAVRITHLPTGLVVSCQKERSQHMNRQVAMKILRARLYELRLQERQAELEAIQGEKKEIGWGNQIRSYVLHPYTLVKDHRTGLEMGNVAAVLDGEIDPFIVAFLKNRKVNTMNR